jgi:DNA-binding IclR family transcriptional regulator
VVYVDQVTPAQTVVMASWVGRRSRKLEAITARTVTDPVKLRAILDQTHRRGYAVSTGELEEGLVTLAVPVIVDGRAVAAVSLSGPSFRIPAGDFSRLARLLVDAGAAVGHRIAGR